MASTSDSQSIQVLPPPSSQPAKIFVDHAHVSIPIFVEANGITNNRPRLMRTLRNGGADICHEPTRAWIILVDRQTQEGRRFVRDWGSDPGKVVLDFLWVHKCIAAGRALLENDAWANCGNLYADYKSDDEENDDNEVEGALRSLPTPRPTPTGPTLPQLPSHPTHNGNGTDRPRQPVTPLSQPNDRQQWSCPSPHQHVTSQSIPMASASQQVPPPGMPPVQQPAVSHESTSSTVPVSFDPSLFSNPSFMQAAMSYYIQNMLGPNVPPHYTNPQAWPSQPPISNQFLVPMHMRLEPSQASYPYSSQDQTASFQPSIPNQTSVPANASLKTSNGISPRPSQEHSTVTQSSLPRAPARTPIAESGGESWRSRLHPSQVSPSPSKSIGRNSAAKSKVASSSTSNDTPGSSSLFSTSAIPPDSPVGLSTPPRSSQSASTSPSQAPSFDPSSTLFLNDVGKPMSFFLQVDMRNRQLILQLIKKHGGRITPDIPKADFVILSPQGSSYAKLCEEVRTSRKKALRTTFVQSCVEAKVIVDEREFILVGTKLSKRRRQPTSSTPVSPVKSPQKLRREPEYDSGGSSRSPTPPSQPEMGSNGKAVYSQKDISFFRRFSRKAFQRELNLTHAALATEIAARAQTHTQGAWAQYVYKHKDDVEEIRHQVRAALDAQRDLQPLDDHQGKWPSKRAKYEAEEEEEDGQDLTSEVTHAIDEDIAWDLNAITSFFARAPQGNDAEVWQRLAQQHRCRTASSWQAFYESRKKDVDDRLKQMTNAD